MAIKPTKIRLSQGKCKKLEMKLLTIRKEKRIKRTRIINNIWILKKNILEVRKINLVGQ
jgi:hypothetical protein